MSAFALAPDLATEDELIPAARRARSKNPYTPVVVAVSLAATVGILAYAWFLLNPRNRGDLVPWTMVIVAEVILIFHALMAMWAIFSGMKNPRTFSFYDAQRNLYDPATNEELYVTDDPTRWPLHLDGEQVKVDILITTYGEPIDVIRRTAEAAMAVRGAHQTWILDDGKSDEVRDLAAGLQIGYVRRLTNHGAKAGNVNNALTVAKGDFFVILDADFVPRPEFLEETLPFMVDPTMAFVQTPQTYGNMRNIISRGAGYMQTMFYRFIQPGRNHFNAAFCVGTNVLFRRAAVLDVGGMYAQSKSEDVWTSLMLHERGWQSTYIAQTMAVGDAPDTIEAYTKQQLRWATGGFEILFTHNPLNPRYKLSLDQRIMYFVTATFYLTGIVPGILLFVPAMEIFLDLHPVNLQVSLTTWFLFYSGFYVLQILLAALTLGTFRWEVLLLAASSFPIYIKALRNALLGVETKWHVTGTTNKKASAFNFMIPVVYTFVFLLGTSIVASWRDITLGHLNVATFWCVVNTLVLGAFIVVGFREARVTPGAPDLTDVDLIDALSESRAIEPLNMETMRAAREQVELLAHGESVAIAQRSTESHPFTTHEEDDESHTAFPRRAAAPALG